MNWNFQKICKFFSGKNLLLKDVQHGLERECLRVTKEGILAQTPHPKKLGLAFTHPYIGTDFAESQVEFASPPFIVLEDALTFLQDLHVFTYEALQDELLWPLSSPCILPEKIPLAQYGSSPEAKKKTLYREGLGLRYGSKMQTLSGVHYNFSFGNTFWRALHQEFGKGELKDFISNSYLHLMRNFLRFGWLNTYLFGASPSLDKTFFSHGCFLLEKFKEHTFIKSTATSLRMSEVGYFAKTQCQAPISYNSLSEYIRDMKKALSSPQAAFEEFEGHQINSNLFQIEAEHYERIRPKPLLQEGLSHLDAIMATGIEYVEVRSIDCNPYYPTGIPLDQILFLELLILYSLFCESPSLSIEERKAFCIDQDRTALQGREKNFSLSGGFLQNWSMSILQDLHSLSFLLEVKKYRGCIERQIEKVSNADLTPSAKILQDMKEHDWELRDFGLYWANKHKDFFIEKKISRQVRDLL